MSPEIIWQCPDGGTCHHECAIQDCFRVACCGPLSGVYPNDQWPASVVLDFSDRNPLLGAIEELIEDHAPDGIGGDVLEPPTSHYRCRNHR